MTRKDITPQEKRRYEGVRRFMRVYGISKEEAEARYDRPKGLCKVCGGPAATARKMYCVGCEDDRNRQWAKEQYHARKARVITSTMRPVVVARKPRGRGESICITPREDVMANAEVIIMPDGLEITKVPSIMPDGVRWKEPETWDEDPKKAAFIDRLLERRATRGRWA